MVLTFLKLHMYGYFRYTLNINSLNLALGRPSGCGESDAEVPYLQCYQISISWEYSRGLLTIVTVVK